MIRYQRIININGCRIKIVANGKDDPNPIITNLDCKYGGAKESKSRVLKQNHNGNGYLDVVINKKHYKVHRLVAMVFIPNPENKSEIDHINTITNDNSINNLRWCTHKENQNNSMTRKHNSKSHIGLYSGANHPMYGKKHSEYTKKKMSENHADFSGSKHPRARKVRCIETQEVFDSGYDAAQTLGLNRTYVVNSANPKCNRKFAYTADKQTKYSFEYVE